MGSHYRLALFLSLLCAGSVISTQGSENFIRNPGFEQPSPEGAADWTIRTDSAGSVRLTDAGAHSGRRCLALAANTAIEQRVGKVPAGAYLIRCWVKSTTEQAITLVIQDPDSPGAAYTYADLQVPKERWVQVEGFCALDRPGSLLLTLGGMSSEFRKYHGGTSEMRAPVLLDDCELIRFERRAGSTPKVLDPGKELGSGMDWGESASWPVVREPDHEFAGTPVIQDAQLAGVVQKEDGSLRLYALQGQALQSRAILSPEPGLANGKSALVQSNGKTGLRVSSPTADRSYTAWLAPEGVIDIEAHGISSFHLHECQLRYGLLPSFVGTDICYDPAKLTEAGELKIPSTRWLVGLRDGGASMLVMVWRSDAQAASLGLKAVGPDRRVDTVSISTKEAGFSLGFVEHPNVWGQEKLNEDWLGEYVPVAWQRPFPARWMAHFFVTAGGKASFRYPHMNYAFPIANAKTRMWGVWFEDWNHYPFYFDGPRLIAHFEKSFVPDGNALFYFLEPAGADVFSPCEIVEQVLGQDEAAALFDLDGNQLRKLHYSTPAEFIYDRPVCATTTRLASVRKDEKATVGVNLATHLFEFIREIRGRVDQYVGYFDEINAYLKAEEQAHPEAHGYIAGLQALILEARAKAKEAYETPLSTVQAKTESMKKLLREGQGDGFDCGTLDVRSPAGTQDDLCRRYNRVVLRLCETAALTCGDSAEKAAIATRIWVRSRQVLRQPTRWEPRRTLYFFEP